jgi:hypothetical protein
MSNKLCKQYFMEKCILYKLYAPHWMLSEEVNYSYFAQHIQLFPFRIYRALWMNVLVEVCQEIDDVGRLDSCFQTENALKCLVLQTQGHK